MPNLKGPGVDGFTLLVPVAPEREAGREPGQSATVAAGRRRGAGFREFDGQ